MTTVLMTLIICVTVYAIVKEIFAYLTVIAQKKVAAEATLQFLTNQAEKIEQQQAEETV